MLRYALYARKSKDDKSGIIKSIKDQLDIWQDLAKSQGLEIVTEYEENKSAKVPGVRPIYAEMISRIKKGEIDGILVWHVNRLARNMEEGGTLAQLLIDGKIREIRTPNWTYRPGDNILPLLLEQGMSTQYSLDLSEAVKRGMNSKVHGGGWPHQANLGYKNDRDPNDPKKGTVNKDPERWDLTRKGFELMLTGGYSVRKAIDIMRSWGLQTRPTPTRPGSPLSYALGYAMFRNCFYAGFTCHNGEVRRGNHPPLITISEFNRLQSILVRRPQKKDKGAPFAYTGMMRCGYCGLQITAERHRKGGKVYTYYHCSDPRNTCTKAGISETELERNILASLEGITVDPQLCEIAQNNIARWQQEDSLDAEKVLEQQQARLTSVETQRDNLLTMALTGALSNNDVYKQREAALLREHNSVRLEIEKTLNITEHIREQARAGFRFVQLARDTFSVSGMQAKKEIARALGVSYVLKGKELAIEIDPLLKQIISYVNEISAILEPGVNVSQTCQTDVFLESCHDGRGARRILEPTVGLMKQLQESNFPILNLV